MATNKNAQIRYNQLDKCFANTGRRYYFNDLLEKVNEILLEHDPDSTGIKTRQLRDDISFMKSEAGYSAPIETILDGKKAYYRYLDPKFSIKNSPVNETEAEHLRYAISILERFEGAPQLEWLNEIGPMLTSQFNLKKTERKIMAFESNIDYSGYDKILPIFNAILNCNVLNVHYEPFDKPEFQLTFHPHYLKQYNNRWFAFGLNEEKNIPTWNLALDRITSIEEVSKQYIESTIEWEDHFYDIIGVTTPELLEVEEIVLIFSKEQAKYVATKPLHPSQKIKYLENEELEVRLKLIPNFEFEMLILSFGEKVKMLKPDNFKQKIIERIENARNNYI